MTRSRRHFSAHKRMPKKSEIAPGFQLISIFRLRGMPQKTQSPVREIDLHYCKAVVCLHRASGGQSFATVTSDKLVDEQRHEGLQGCVKVCTVVIPTRRRCAFVRQILPRYDRRARSE